MIAGTGGVCRGLELCKKVRIPGKRGGKEGKIRGDLMDYKLERICILTPLLPRMPLFTANWQLGCFPSSLFRMIASWAKLSG